MAVVLSFVLESVLIVGAKQENVLGPLLLRDIAINATVRDGVNGVVLEIATNLVVLEIKYGFFV